MIVTRALLSLFALASSVEASEKALGHTDTSDTASLRSGDNGLMVSVPADTGLPEGVQAPSILATSKVVVSCPKSLDTIIDTILDSLDCDIGIPPEMKIEQEPTLEIVPEGFGVEMDAFLKNLNDKAEDLRKVHKSRFTDKAIMEKAVQMTKQGKTAFIAKELAENVFEIANQKGKNFAVEDLKKIVGIVNASEIEMFGRGIDGVVKKKYLNLISEMDKARKKKQVQDLEAFEGLKEQISEMTKRYSEKSESETRQQYHPNTLDRIKKFFIRKGKCKAEYLGLEANAVEIEKEATRVVLSVAEQSGFVADMMKLDEKIEAMAKQPELIPAIKKYKERMNERVKRGQEASVLRLLKEQIHDFITQGRKYLSAENLDSGTLGAQEIALRIVNGFNFVATLMFMQEEPTFIAAVEKFQKELSEIKKIFQDYLDYSSLKDQCCLMIKQNQGDSGVNNKNDKKLDWRVKNLEHNIHRLAKQEKFASIAEILIKEIAEDPEHKELSAVLKKFVDTIDKIAETTFISEKNVKDVMLEKLIPVLGSFSDSIDKTVQLKGHTFIAEEDEKADRKLAIADINAFFEEIDEIRRHQSLADSKANRIAEEEILKMGQESSTISAIGKYFEHLAKLVNKVQAASAINETISQEQFILDVTILGKEIQEAAEQIQSSAIGEIFNETIGDIIQHKEAESLVTSHKEKVNELIEQRCDSFVFFSFFNSIEKIVHPRMNVKQLVKFAMEKDFINVLRLIRDFNHWDSPELALWFHMSGYKGKWDNKRFREKYSDVNWSKQQNLSMIFEADNPEFLRDIQVSQEWLKKPIKLEEKFILDWAIEYDAVKIFKSHLSSHFSELPALEKRLVEAGDFKIIRAFLDSGMYKPNYYVGFQFYRFSNRLPGTSKEFDLFWSHGLNYIPRDKIFLEMCRTGRIDLIEKMSKYFGNISYELVEACQEQAMSNGHLSFLEQIDTYVEVDYHDIAVHAIANGQFEFFKRIATNLEFSDRRKQEMADLAASKNHLDAIREIHKIFGVVPKASKLGYASTEILDFVKSVDPNAIDENIIPSANISTLEWLKNNGYDYLMTVETKLHFVFVVTDPEALFWARENWRLTVSEISWDITKNDLELLQKLHEETGLPLSDDFVEKAVDGGHIEILLWIHDKFPHLLSSAMVIRAIERGRLDIVKHFKDLLGPIDMNEVNLANVCGGGHLEMLQWLLDECNVQIEDKDVIAAFDYDQVNMIAWIWEKKVSEFDFAAHFSAIEESTSCSMREFFTKKGVVSRLDRESEFIKAFKRGDLEMVKHLVWPDCYNYGPMYNCEISIQNNHVKEWLKKANHWRSDKEFHFQYFVRNHRQNFEEDQIIIMLQ